MPVKKIHFASGIILAIFIHAHLFNHLASIAGVNRHLEIMNRLRAFYRHPLVETVLLGAICFQIVTGLKLAGTKRKMAVTFFEKLQVWTGLYLSFFFIIHLSAVLIGRGLLHLDTNFYFGAAGLNSFPANLFFIPYYALAILSFYGHIAAVHQKKVKRSCLYLSPRHQSFLLLAFGFCLAVLILYGFTNGFKGVKIPADYEVLTGKHLFSAAFGHWNASGSSLRYMPALNVYTSDLA